VTLDVGGKNFRLLRETIMKYPHSTLAQVLTGKDTHNLIKVDNSYFFDRNPHYFEVVLDFMRNGKLIKPDKLSAELLNEELKFWKLKVDSEPEAKKVEEVKKTEPIEERIDATLVMSMDDIEPTLLIPEETNETQEYAPTLLMNEYESTLLMTELPTTQEILEVPPKKDIVQEAKVESSRSYVPIEKDDLLGTLLNTQPEPAREERKLPWANKTGGPTQKATNSKKPTSTPNKRRKIAKDTESEPSIGTESYDSSFIDDKEAEELLGTSKVKEQPKRATNSRYKKVALPTAAEMKQAIKGLGSKNSEEIPKPQAKGKEEVLPQKRPAEPEQKEPEAPKSKPRVLIYGLDATKKTQIGTKVRKLGGVVVKGLDDNPTHVIMPDLKKDIAQMQSKGLQFASEEWLDNSLAKSSWLSASAFNPLP